ncbi:MAG: hypothetical protein A2066_06660 [Bacteroidetes bacterium GWB2_41_8]|nr:MAG: hypothetical protein A2066_06660 [Bacteroidetes bacterium GWB2_41_8]
MSFPKELEEVDGGTIGGQVGEIANKLTSGAQKILELILANPRISRKDLSQILGINESAIQKYLKLLKEKKIIERVDTTTGYWKILAGA